MILEEIEDSGVLIQNSGIFRFQTNIHESISEGECCYTRDFDKIEEGGVVFTMDLCAGVLHEFLTDLHELFF